MLRRVTLELVLIMVMLVISIIFLWLAQSYPLMASRFPKVISSFSLVLAVVLLITKIWPNARVDSGRNVKPGQNGLSWIVFSGLMVLYAIVMQIVGFIAATFLYLLCCPFLMGLKNPMRLGMIAIISALLLFVCTRWVLHVPIPVGWLFGQ